MRLGLILSGLVAHLALRLLLSDWLNGGDDIRFWVAIVACVTPLAASVAAIARGLLSRG